MASVCPDENLLRRAASPSSSMLTVRGPERRRGSPASPKRASSASAEMPNHREPVSSMARARSTALLLERRLDARGRAAARIEREAPAEVSDPAGGRSACEAKAATELVGLGVPRVDLEDAR